MTFVTDEHKAELSQTSAIRMVQAHLFEFVPKDGQIIWGRDAIEHTKEIVGPIYGLCQNAVDGGLDAAIKNAYWQLCRADTGCIERSGQGNPAGDLKRGQWRFRSDGYKRCSPWLINDLERYLTLAADVMLNNELASEDNRKTRKPTSKKVSRVDQLIAELTKLSNKDIALTA